ncbi:protein ALP1-like [Tripterygium wilfordii]|uniref:protein ALP1-like n=1 Tax=Tripterygium wilfordii TaxID=458696 RepID=UPI0018F83902|nr:protein ALP1-like [Tripterygium wilfordii]
MNSSSSSSDDDDGVNLSQILLLHFLKRQFEDRGSISRSRRNMQCRTCTLTGRDWVADVLQGHPVRCHEAFRMPVEVFHALCGVLRDDYGLIGSDNVGILEMVAMFVSILGHAQANRDIQERFQHSGETISRLFHKVLLAVLKLSKDIIQPRGNSLHETPRYIREHSKISYRICFKDCIGALDGTHISAMVGPENRQRYIGRKGVATQNVLAVCDFDMMYTYISAGWEGSAHDSRVLEHSLRVERMKFPKPPRGKYYLVDAGYANKTGFLAPYKGERYHVPVFQNGAPASGPREVFNKAHARLWNVIERTFGVTKKKWRILNAMTSYDIKVQAMIVIACMALHNFIRIHAVNDVDFNDIGSTSTGGDHSVSDPVHEVTDNGVDEYLVIDDANMAQFRDMLADQLSSAI